MESPQKPIHTSLELGIFDHVNRIESQYAVGQVLDEIRGVQVISD